VLSFPHRVYRLRKALYGLKKAPHAWYGHLRGFLFNKGFEMDKFDKTLFLLKQGADILIVQVYVYDIVFGGSSHSLISRFCKGCEQRIQDVYDGRIAVLSRASDQVGKGENFVHQANYMKDIPKKFKMDDSKFLSTPMSTTTAHDADEDREPMDQKEYRSMIGSHLYLMATRPNIQFSVCLCARFEASLRTSHRQAVKQIFRYILYTPNLVLWYSVSSSLLLLGFSDADFAGC
jgi:hypothetical protein